MSEKKSTNQPFHSLGNRLKSFRSKRHESLVEVSGAVEIDAERLSEIEQGKVRPSEDILLLLISYFGIKEDEASELWKMAGYNSSDFDTDQDFVPNSSDIPGGVTQVMVMPMDARVVYTDMVHVMVNDHGVVINFMQGAGLNGQPLAVSRVGMSKTHAKSLLDILQKTMGEAEKPKTIKQLPEGKKPNNPKDRKTKKS